MTDPIEPPAATAAAIAEPRPKLLSATDLALIAAFAALIAALAYIGAIPVAGAGVPITLQTLGVALAGRMARKYYSADPSSPTTGLIGS